MRDDLDKLLCERERPRSWDHYSNYRDLKRFESLYDDAYVDDRIDQDDEMFTGTGNGYRESMKFRYGWDKKPFGENLNPLYGVIRKSVGRRWDRVYSELCKVFDPRSVTGKHILQHVYDQLPSPSMMFVDEQGRVCVHSAGGVSAGSRLVRDTYYDFYVDPRDGVLKRNIGRKTYKQIQRERLQQQKIEEAKVKRVISDDVELHMIDGVWFEIRFVTFPGSTTSRLVESPWTKRATMRTITEYPFQYDVLKRQTVQAQRVAVSKRTISHRELKRYGLVI